MDENRRKPAHDSIILIIGFMDRKYKIERLEELKTWTDLMTFWRESIHNRYALVVFVKRVLNKYTKKDHPELPSKMDEFFNQTFLKLKNNEGEAIPFVVLEYDVRWAFWVTKDSLIKELTTDGIIRESLPSHPSPKYLEKNIIFEQIDLEGRSLDHLTMQVLDLLYSRISPLRRDDS